LSGGDCSWFKRNNRKETLVTRNYYSNNNKKIVVVVVIMYKYNTHFTDEITLLVAQIVNTEQLQNYIPYKRGFFQVYNCKYPA